MLKIIKALHYPLLRFWSILKKEIIQIKRDFGTYIFIILVPFIEVILFGNIINTDAKNLPTVILSHDHSVFSNSLIQGFKNTGYFRIIKQTDVDTDAEKMLRSGEVQFVITIPNNFAEDLIKEKHPHVLVEGDASDPLAIGNAFNAAATLANSVLNQDLKGSLSYLKNQEPLFFIDTHAKYNPLVVAQFHTLPGILAIILTVTLVMLTAISVTTEYDQGTMEMLLITPIKPLEVLIGKIIPNAIFGYIIFVLTLGLSRYGFHVPFEGSFFLLSLCAIPYIISCLGIGLAVSTVSRSQLRAANVANTYILPAILFSGFLFPFYAMPGWAQWIGEVFPPTHFIRITLSIMLKGATFSEVWPNLWPIILFACFIIFISFRYYRKTLD
ncbi:MAG: ABC transporter permease [Legionella sp.]|nr:MAG: ABC transporter permease [Legionella sp.]